MKLGLRGKLFLLSGVLILLCAITGMAGYFITKEVGSSYQKITTANLPNVRTILTAQGEVRSLRMYLYMLAAPGITQEMKDRAYKRYQENWDAFDKEMKNYTSLPFGPGEDELWKDLEPKIKQLREACDKAIALSKEIKSDIDTEARAAMVEALSKEVAPISNKYAESIAKIVTYHNEFAEKNAREAVVVENRGNLFLFAMIGSSIAIGFLIAFFMARDLTTKFRQISMSLNEAGNEVSQASGQVASASQELSQAVHEQAASIQETAASLEELTSTIAKNSDTSKDAEKISMKSKDSATHGREVVGEMMKSMDEINLSNQKIAEQVDKSNKEIADIVKVITEIGNKTKVINDIVFQTKLLSFNASVEAARAGENGKGFAVVAEEVGNLAQMSGKAANEISTMLDESIHKVTSIVRDSQEQVNRLITDGVQKLNKGNDIAKECGDVFNEIFDEISNISVMSGEISMASEEQTKGVQEINSAVSNLDLATQQNASVSQQAAAAAEQLSRQADSLKTMVSDLLGVVDGTQKAGASASYEKVKNTVAKKETPMQEKKIVAFVAPAVKKEKAKPAMKLVEKVEVKEAKKEAKKEVTKITPKKSDLSIPSSDDERFEDVV